MFAEIAMGVLGAMAVLVMFPFLALIPVAVFAVLYAKSKSGFVLFALVLWLLYLTYEYGMYLRILCTGECNIRIDLLVIFPTLILVSIVALIMLAIKVRRRPQS